MTKIVKFLPAKIKRFTIWPLIERVWPGLEEYNFVKVKLELKAKAAVSKAFTGL